VGADHDEGAAARLIGAWAAASAAAPRRTLTALAAAAALALALASTFLSVDADSRRMLSPDLPFQQRARALEAAFPDLRDTLLIVVEGEGPEAVEAAAAALADALAARPEFADVHAPVADPYLRRTWPLLRGEADLARDLARLSSAANLIARLREDRTVSGFLAAAREAAALALAAGEPERLDAFHREAAAVWAAAREDRDRPLSWRRLLAGDAEDAAPRALLQARIRPDPTQLSPARPALDAAAEEIARLKAAPGLSVAVTGEPAMRAEELRAVAEGIGLSLALSLALIAVILTLGLGGVRAAGRALFALFLSLALALGAAAAFAPLNLISVAFVVLLTGLGVDYAIHLLAHLRRGGGAVAVALSRRIGPTIALAAATTAASFLAFATTDFRGLAQLGALGGVGVAIAFATTLTALPALAALSGDAAAPEPGTVTPRPLDHKRALLLGGVAAAIALGAGWVAREARFDANPLNLRPPDAPAAAAFAALAGDPATTPYRLDVLADDAREAAALARDLAALPEVEAVRRFATFVPRDQAAKLDLLDLAWPSVSHALEGAPAPLAAESGAPREALLAALTTEAAGPGARAFAAQLATGDPPEAALQPLLFRWFPDLLDRLRPLAEVGPVAEADVPDALRRRWIADDGARRVSIIPAEDLRAPDAMRRFVEAAQTVAPEAGGAPDQIVGAARVVGRALATATGLALAATLALTLAATRRAADALAVVAPVAAAGAVTAAAGVLLDMPFNYANIIVAPLLIGFGVDTALFLAHAARGGGGRPDAATARAVVVSALTTAAAFGTLALSPHPGTASMGLTLLIALAASVAAGFTLTPAVLALFEPGGAGRLRRTDR